MITGEIKSKVDRIWDTLWSELEDEITKGRKELEGLLK